MLPLETVKKPSGRMAAHGYLAWGRMEFPFVGRLSVCYDCGRKISLFKNIESVSMVGTFLYDDIDSAVLAAFCSGRNSEYRSVSGTIVPVF